MCSSNVQCHDSTTVIDNITAGKSFVHSKTKSKCRCFQYVSSRRHFVISSPGEHDFIALKLAMSLQFLFVSVRRSIRNVPSQSCRLRLDRPKWIPRLLIVQNSFWDPLHPSELVSYHNRRSLFCVVWHFHATTMSMLLNTLEETRYTTKIDHYGNSIYFLPIVGGRSWQENEGNLSRIQCCRNQAWFYRRDDTFDLAVYFDARRNLASQLFELPTHVVVELFNLMKELASYEKKITILIDKNLDENKYVYAILHLGNYLDVIKGLELASNLCPVLLESIFKNESLEYLGFDLAQDVFYDEYWNQQYRIGKAVTTNKSIKTFYFKIPADIKEHLLNQLGKSVNENTAIKNLNISLAHSHQPTKLSWIFDAIRLHHSVRSLTITYVRERQIHDAMVKYCSVSDGSRLPDF